MRSATTAPESGLVFRPAQARVHSQLDWLDSWHTLSFAGHHDPAWMGFGPLRVINDDTIAAGRGFGMHPHRNMEIVTVMIEGQLNHRDSMGHAEVLRARSAAHERRHGGGAQRDQCRGSALPAAADLDRTQQHRTRPGR